MITGIRAEAYKLVTTRGNAGIAAAVIGLVSLGMLVHVLSLDAQELATRSKQLSLVTDVGVAFGSLFAALVGALGITVEYRTGTIRPTLLTAPRRGAVLAAKAVCALAAGAATGLVAAGTATGIGAIGVAGRGITDHLTAGDIAQLLVGSTGSGALWAVIGLGVGAAARAQVPTIVGLFAWILLVEQILNELPRVKRYAPGALARALAGQTGDAIVGSVALAAVLLIAYAAAAFLVGLSATTRRDIP